MLKAQTINAKGHSGEGRKSIRIAASFTPEQFAFLKKIAVANKVPISEIIRFCVAKEMPREQKAVA